MTHLRFLDADLRAQFEQQGFVKIRLLQPDEAHDFAGQLTQSLGDRLEGRSPDDVMPGFYQSVGAVSDEAALEANQAIRELLEPRLAQYIENFDYHIPGIASKGSEGMPVPLHTHPVWTLDADAPRLICWCSLTDATAENGAIRLVPGGHRLCSSVRAHGVSDYYDGFRAEIESYAQTIEVAAGEALLMDDTLPHGSVARGSGAPRIAIGGMLLDAGATLACSRVDNGMIEWLEADIEQVREFAVRAQLPTDARVLKSIPDGARGMTFAEFEQLLQSGKRAKHGFDPLAELRSANTAPQQVPAAPRPLHRRAIGKMRRLAGKAYRKIAGPALVNASSGSAPRTTTENENG